MEKNDKTTLKAVMKSFGYALNGLKYVFRTERNMKIHAAICLLVIPAGIFFDLNRFEWLILLLCAGLVIIMEIINTAVERMVDFISLEKSNQAMIIKNTSAAAVLVAAIITVVAGAVIFIPHILQLLTTF